MAVVAAAAAEPHGRRRSHPVETAPARRIAPARRGQGKEARAGKQEKDRWGDAFDFRIEVDDEEIRVAVEGVPRLAWPHGGRHVHGELSLQINKGLCVFEDLRVEPLRR